MPVASPRPLRRRRRAAGLFIGIVAVVVALAVAGLPLYVFPPQGDPRGADLVYVIGPPSVERTSLAEQLRRAPTPLPVLISVSGPGTADARLIPAGIPLCHDLGVTCHEPSPFTTMGEARMLRAYAVSHHVGKTVILTFTPHVARTRYIFDKCYGGDVTVVGVDEHLSLLDWAYQYAYQTAAFVKAWATPCP